LRFRIHGELRGWDGFRANHGLLLAAQIAVIAGFLFTAVVTALGSG
jgi:hypothetical protein